MSLVVGEEGSDFEVDLIVLRVWADHTDGRAPALPRAVPWAATYEAGARPSPISHWASEALRLPVTGSSMSCPWSLEKKARTSKSTSLS